MSLFAVHLNGVAILPGCTHDDFAGSTLAVQRIANISAQAGLIHATGAVDTALLRNGEEDLDIAMRSAAFQEQANALQDAFYAAFIVTT